MTDPPPISSSGPASGGDDRDALVARAMACRHAGRFTQAAALLGQAMARDPENAALRLLSGETLYRLGRLLSAADAVESACAKAPGNPDAEFLAGRILTALGRSADAVAAFERALRGRPDYAAARRFMAPPLAALGRSADADAAFERADAQQAEPAEFYNQLGIDLLGQRRAVEAEAAFRRAIKLAPRLAPAHQNLGAALAAQERLPEAIAAERRAIELAPNSAAAWNNLGVFEGAAGDLAGSRRAILRALEIEPTHVDALNSLAQIRLEEGDARTAVELQRRVLAVQPTHRAAGGALLVDRNYIPDVPAQDSLIEARAIATRLRPEGPPFTFSGHDRTPDRRLRIGYVSGDFRRHSCASFIAPLFAAHDPNTVEVIAYSENPCDDEITDALRARVQAWRSIAMLGDGAVSELIHRDHIDILVDLSGHMAGNRLPVFALKPAPLQVTWLGYPNTTGLGTIDYRLTDDRADPPGATDAFHSERLWRLPECFLVFGADPLAPAIHQRPPDAPFTFGSFNHLPKVTPEVVAVWSRILAAVPGSRLLMKSKRLGDPHVRDRYAHLFAGHGIAPERLDLVGWQTAPAAHLALYQDMDLALDPFPYNGTTTTCEALWMGVPVVTLAGDRHAGRVGASLLGAVGLKSLITGSAADYADCAIALARAPTRLADLRAGLRDRVRASTLCDARGFARRIEAAFREMWRLWCVVAD